MFSVTPCMKLESFNLFIRLNNVSQSHFCTNLKNLSHFFLLNCKVQFHALKSIRFQNSICTIFGWHKKSGTFTKPFSWCRLCLGLKVFWKQHFLCLTKIVQTCFKIKWTLTGTPEWILIIWYHHSSMSLLKGCSDLFGDAHFSLSKSNLQFYHQSFHTFSSLTWIFFSGT